VEEVVLQDVLSYKTFSIFYHDQTVRTLKVLRQRRPRELRECNSLGRN